MINEATNVCDNTCLWDGNTSTWTPPPGYLMLVQATTPAKIWVWNDVDKIWQLEVQEGAGGIGFTWDGTYLNTNDPMPPVPNGGAIEGAQTL